MTESQAWDEIASGSVSDGVWALQNMYFYQWVPGSYAARNGKSYTQFDPVEGGIRSLVDRQTAFEVNGGTNGSISDLLGLLGDGTEPQELPFDGDGENPQGLPFDGLGLLAVPWWLWLVLLFAFAMKSKRRG